MGSTLHFTGLLNNGPEARRFTGSYRHDDDFELNFAPLVGIDVSQK